MKVKISTSSYSVQCSAVQNTLNANFQKLEGCTSKIIYLPSFLCYLNWLLLETTYQVKWKLPLIWCNCFHVGSTHACLFTIKNPGVTQMNLSILRPSFFSRPSLFAPPYFFSVVRSTQFHPSNFSGFSSISLQDA